MYAWREATRKMISFVYKMATTTGVPTVQSDASQAYNAELIGLLPPAPARLLLVGAHTNTELVRWEALGYQVSHFLFNSSQANVQCPAPTRQGGIQLDLPLPETMAASFAGALVSGLSPHVHPMALWDQLAQWLSDGARVVMLGPVLSDQPPRVNRWLEYLTALGARCGFSEQDLTQSLSVGNRHSFVRAFHKATTPRWQLRHVRATDFTEIASLFLEVFGHPLSRKLWDWKYANGHGNAVSASRDGVMIAHYGGMYREILLCGTPEWAYGGCDVMVHPKERGVMTRQGPFLLTAATTAEIYGPVAFGFPTERAMLVAEKMGLYARAGQMTEVRWEPSPPRARLRTRVRALMQGNAEDQALVESMWGAMAHDLHDGVVGVRDWKYLGHRYFNHPHNYYEVLAVAARLTGKPLGIVVLRRLEGSCELLDVIAPLANLPLVIDQARRMTARWALPYLYCWITTNYAHWFVACAGKEEALNVLIPTSCWTDDPRVDMLKNKWWLMSGDTDFR